MVVILGDQTFDMDVLYVHTLVVFIKVIKHVSQFCYTSSFTVLWGGEKVLNKFFVSLLL